MLNDKLITKQFGENLSRILENRGMTQKDLALRLAIAPSAVNAWVKCKKMPRMSKIDKICEILGVERGALIQNLPNLPTNYPNLTYEEGKIIDAYRCMDRQHQIVVREIMGTFTVEGKKK